MLDLVIPATVTLYDIWTGISLDKGSSEQDFIMTMRRGIRAYRTRASI